MEIREATKKDIDGILELVNRVFCRSNNKPETMESQFPYLFSDLNVGNLLVAVDDQKIVSHVGFHTTSALIMGVPVTISSIGSVATDPNYRNQGLGTKLLQQAFKKMKNEKADIILISGTRGLYKRNGCYSVGKLHQFVATSSPINNEGRDSYKLEPVPNEVIFHNNIAEKLIEIENEDKTRFIHSTEELKVLYKAAGYCRIFPWRQELFKIERDEKMLAYFIVGFEAVEDGEERAHVIEFYGDRKALAKGFLQLFAPHVIEIIIPILDAEKQLAKCLNATGFAIQKTDTYPGTIKLSNPLMFWIKFKSFIVNPNKKADLAEVSNGVGYHLYIDGDLVWESNEEQFAQWIFSQLPLPWPNGLNYI